MNNGTILIDREYIKMDDFGRVGRFAEGGYKFTNNSLWDELAKRYYEIVAAEFSEWMSEVAP